MASYYTGESGEHYFRERRKCLDEHVQAERARHFRPYVSPGATVLDFGCGTGGILAALSCDRRLGIEINERAANIARRKGIEVFHEISELPDHVADVVITHHALEHVVGPFAVLEELRLKLKVGGRIVIVVPAEEPRRRKNRQWHQKAARHLYCWNAVTLGNLLSAAGYRLEKAYLTESGSSRYLLWFRKLRVVNRAYSYLRSRWSAVAVASRGPLGFERSSGT